MADLQLARNLTDVDVLAFEGEGGVARDNGKGRNLAEVGDYVFADAVGEIFLLGITAHIGKGQNADVEAALARVALSPLHGGGAGRARREDVNRTLYVLDLVEAQIFEHGGDFSGDLIGDVARQSDAADGGQRLQPRGDVDALAINVVALDNDVAKIDADAIAQALALGLARLGRFHRLLNFKRTGDRGGGA